MSQTKPLLQAAAGILMKNQKILIQKRPLGKPFEGYWEFPGGKIESQERPEEALHRELKEELGVEIPQESAKFLWIFPVKLETHPHHVSLHLFLLETWKNSPKAQEGQHLEWVSYDALGSLKPLMPGVLESAELLHYQTIF